MFESPQDARFLLDFIVAREEQFIISIMQDGCEEEDARVLAAGIIGVLEEEAEDDDSQTTGSRILFIDLARDARDRNARFLLTVIDTGHKGTTRIEDKATPEQIAAQVVEICAAHGCTCVAHDRAAIWGDNRFTAVLDAAGIAQTLWISNSGVNTPA